MEHCTSGTKPVAQNINIKVIDTAVIEKSKATKQSVFGGLAMTERKMVREEVKT